MQALDCCGLFKLIISWPQLFRKLLLYPTELRGLSNPFIFGMALLCIPFLDVIHSNSRKFTSFHNIRVGNRGENPWSLGLGITDSTGGIFEDQHRRKVENRP